VGFHRTSHFQFLREGFFRAGQQVIYLFVAGLEADLDMVQAGLLEVADLLLGEADAGSDQVGVEPQFASLGDQLGQVLTHQRFTAGKPQLRGAHFPGFAKYLDPLLGAQFLALLGKVQRVGAIRALQRAAVSQLGQQPQRQANGRLFRQG